MTHSPLSAMLGKQLAHRLFDPPRKKHHRTPAQFNLPCAAQTTATSDGVKLHLWLMPSTGVGIVAVGHGTGLTKSASLRHAALLHDLGYHVILFDHRNHGLSGTDPARDNLAERYSADIEACLGVAEATWPEAGRPIVWGFSFSTFPTLYSLRRPTNTPIRAIICDSGPGYDLRHVLTSFLSGGGPPGPSVMNRLAQRPAVAHSFATTAIDMLAATWPPVPTTPITATTPMLFLTGSSDHIIEPGQVMAVASLYPHATVAEHSGHHLRGITEAPDTYKEAVAGFLRDSSPSPESSPGH